jgi:hypothetical protein
MPRAPRVPTEGGLWPLQPVRTWVRQYDPIAPAPLIRLFLTPASTSSKFSVVILPAGFPGRRRDLTHAD